MTKAMNSRRWLFGAGTAALLIGLLPGLMRGPLTNALSTAPRPDLSAPGTKAMGRIFEAFGAPAGEPMLYADLAAALAARGFVQTGTLTSGSGAINTTWAHADQDLLVEVTTCESGLLLSDNLVGHYGVYFGMATEAAIRRATEPGAAAVLIPDPVRERLALIRAGFAAAAEAGDVQSEGLGHEVFLTDPTPYAQQEKLRETAGTVVFHMASYEILAGSGGETGMGAEDFGPALASVQTNCRAVSAAQG
ncbi:hypothetical protein HOY34_08110 [Xinfangfangia sp. D13-10-4-6]|uniref:hypothetical protein n=1 Tax=Pseudogemmobacter hezensis TaxID=2737662 RepID=UPI001557095C|nr:hypothetical protein [Pseudogemmobacter hezensis]NPD15164.1 hypothetical protein [Pseudogemmobacter hezensis]